MEQKPYDYYRAKANEVLHVLQADGYHTMADYASVIGLVVKKMIDTAVENGEDRETVVSAMCEVVKRMGEE